MTNIEDIPAPLPTYICKFLPDLKSLDAATRASPTFAAAFARDSAEIFEAIMAASLSEEVIVLLRSDVLRQRTQQHSSTTDLGSDSVVTRLKTLSSAAATALSNDNAPENAVFATVRAFTRLHSLAIAIISTKLTYLHTLRFEHLADPYFLYNRDPLPREDPVGRIYEIGPLSPPYWVEEQRVMRALWRIKLFSDLATADANPTVQRGMDDQLVSAQDETATFDALRETLPEHPRDDFDEIVNSLLALPTHTISLAAAFPPVATIRVTLATAPTTWTAPAAVPTLTTPLLHAWHTQDSPRGERRTQASAFFHSACKRWPHSPLRDAEWEVLRALGLGIWSLQRMAEELELMPVPQTVRPPANGKWFKVGMDGRLSSSDQLFTWRGLYLQEVERGGRRRAE